MSNIVQDSGYDKTNLPRILGIYYTAFDDSKTKFNYASNGNI